MSFIRTRVAFYRTAADGRFVGAEFSYASCARRLRLHASCQRVAEARICYVSATWKYYYSEIQNTRSVTWDKAVPISELRWWSRPPVGWERVSSSVKTKRARSSDQCA